MGVDCRVAREFWLARGMHGGYITAVSVRWTREFVIAIHNEINGHVDQGGCRLLANPRHPDPGILAPFIIG